jgi:hypothetical protein
MKKSYMDFINELSLTTLVRYRQKAGKINKKVFSSLANFDKPMPSGSVLPRLKKLKNTSQGMALSTKKINKKMQVGRLNKTQE